jgi:hypothetical protein
MMGNGKPEAAKFIDPPPLQENARLDVQIKTKLLEHIRDVIRVGYYNPQQKALLEKNVGKVVNTLCMLEKHWKKFFVYDFPRIPSKYDSDELLELVAECERNSTSKSDRLKIDLVSTHI